jgi:hypothetical protein
MHDTATAMLGAVTIDSLIEQLLQNGLLGVVAGLVTWGVRSLWLFFKPHVNEALRARLKRYEATTKLTAGLEQTLYEMLQQQKLIVQIMDTINHDSRGNRKAVQGILRLMKHHKCLAGVDVRSELIDSDEFDLDESSDSDKPTQS